MISVGYTHYPSAVNLLSQTVNEEEGLYAFLLESMREMHGVAMQNAFLNGLREGGHSFCAKAYVHYLCNLFVLHEAIEELQNKIIHEYGQDYFIFPELFRSQKLPRDIQMWSVFNPSVAKYFADKDPTKTDFVERIRGLAEDSVKDFIKELKAEPLLLAIGAFFALYGTAMSGGQDIRAGVKDGFVVRIKDLLEKDPEELKELPQSLQDIVAVAKYDEKIIYEKAEESVSFFDFGKDFSIFEFKKKWHANLDSIPGKLKKAEFEKGEFFNGVSRIANRTVKEFLGFIESMLKKLANEKEEA
jgi:hypothetical protein